eukprot:scaffold128423_cov66-Phaeocystis_antarctica.AAC.1
MSPCECARVAGKADGDALRLADRRKGGLHEGSGANACRPEVLHVVPQRIKGARREPAAVRPLGGH